MTPEELPTHTVLLPSLAATERLAALLAQELSRLHFRVLLLTGPLGSGKTTLIRALVKALPGSEQAEVASPSFALCHHYPVEPPVLHADLYRCQKTSLPEDLEEALDDEEVAVLIEWAEFLPSWAYPKTYLRLCLSPGEEGRLLTLTAQGRGESLALATLVHEYAAMEGEEPAEAWADLSHVLKDVEKRSENA